MRFDSLREITASLLAEANKINHVGITNMTRRSTLSDANARRPEAFFGAVYKPLYERYKGLLSVDSRKNDKYPHWEGRLRIIDSTTISLFSNLLFKGSGRNPKRRKKKCGLNVHEIIHTIEEITCGVYFISAAKHDSLILVPGRLVAGDIIATDRAYFDYSKQQRMTELGVTYVTKMKKNLKYRVKKNIVYPKTNDLVARKEQTAEFLKTGKKDCKIYRRTRIITHFNKESKNL